MNMKSRHGTRGAQRSGEIDLALAVMCALQQPGQVVSHQAISHVTGLSHGGSWAIEKEALKKLRNRLFFGRENAAWRELRT